MSSKSREFDDNSNQLADNSVQEQKVYENDFDKLKEIKNNNVEIEQINVADLYQEVSNTRKLSPLNFAEIKIKKKIKKE